MFSRFLIAATLLLAAACQSTSPPDSSSQTLSVVLSATPAAAGPLEATPDAPPTATADDRWLETEMNGVTLGMWRPTGWETDLSDGLVLAEYSMSSTGMDGGGILVYCFVPPSDEFTASSAADENYARTVLNQVVKMPSHTGRDVTVSQPISFMWGTYPAAYYLITTGDGVRAMVLALTIPTDPQVVVCNVSVEAAQADRIRSALPWLLDGLTIDGASLSGSALNALPDPLPFPRYSRASNTVNSRVSGGSR